MNEEELERLAAEELLREAKQGAARAVVHGALGWKKESVPRPNKRFLSTTLANTMQYNHRRPRSSSPHRRHNSHSRNVAHQSHYSRAQKTARDSDHGRHSKRKSDHSPKVDNKSHNSKEHRLSKTDKRRKDTCHKRKSRSH